MNTGKTDHKSLNLENRTYSKLPNYLVVGPQKAGTSWISEYLKFHGAAHLPNGVKETFFFDKYYHKGIDWYRNHFVEINRESDVQVEVAPTYFENDEVIENVREMLGEVPIICTFRDPAKRTFSLYQHFKRYGMTKLPFREAVVKLKLYEGSMYAQKIKLWSLVFGEENLKFLFLEDLANDPDLFAQRLCGYLGLEFKSPPEQLKQKVFGAAESPNFWLAKITNTSAQFLRSFQLYSIVNFLKKTPLKNLILGNPKTNKPAVKLNDADRSWLIDTYFKQDIVEFEKLVQRSLDHWKV